MVFRSFEPTGTMLSAARSGVSGFTPASSKKNKKAQPTELQDEEIRKRVFGKCPISQARLHEQNRLHARSQCRRPLSLLQHPTPSALPIRDRLRHSSTCFIRERRRGAAMAVCNACEAQSLRRLHTSATRTGLEYNSSVVNGVTRAA